MEAQETRAHLLNKALATQGFWGAVREWVARAHMPYKTQAIQCRRGRRAQAARAYLSNKNSRDKVVLVREPNNPARTYSIKFLRYSVLG